MQDQLGFDWNEDDAAPRNESPAVPPVLPRIAPLAEKLHALAVAVIRNGRPFSRPGLPGVLSQTEYNRTAALMVRRGLALDLPGNRRELTPAGRAVLRRVLGE